MESSLTQRCLHTPPIISLGQIPDQDLERELLISGRPSKSPHPGLPFGHTTQAESGRPP